MKPRADHGKPVLQQPGAGGRVGGLASEFHGSLRLCLDFVNTVSWGGAERRNERLRSYPDLVHWAREAALLPPTAAARLSRAAEAAPRRAARALADAHARLRLRAGADGCCWTFPEHGDDLDRMLWPVAWSAAELLTSDAAGAIRMCAGERCGWLFLDRSRNRSRRWCDMRVCGNAAKARRFYARRKAAAGEGSGGSEGLPASTG